MTRVGFGACEAKPRGGGGAGGAGGAGGIRGAGGGDGGGGGGGGAVRGSTLGGGGGAVLALNAASSVRAVGTLDRAIALSEEQDGCGGGAGARLAKAICPVRFGAASSALALASSSLSCWIFLSRSARASIVRMAMTSGSRGGSGLSMEEGCEVSETTFAIVD